MKNKNGWPVIGRLLEARGKNQSDLARLLKVSPACITQIKHGDYSLAAEAFSAILTYLNASIEDRQEFYTHVVNSRYFNGRETVKVSFLPTGTPPGRGLQ